MQTVLIVIHIMVVLALIATVLLQRSEGGALGIGGGGGFMTGRGQANVLTRATAILAAMFFATSLGLTLLANFGHSNRSIFENAVAPASAPATQGTVLQQLQKEQQERAQQPRVPAPPGEPETPRSQ
jgi:preprotein translocase subunit SecG